MNNKADLSSLAYEISKINSNMLYNLHINCVHDPLQEQRVREAHILVYWLATHWCESVSFDKFCNYLH